MAKKSKGMSVGEEVAIGAGVLAAAAAAGAGYYFYGSAGAKKHRAAAAKWTKNLKTDVVKRAKKLEKIDAKIMAAVVDEAAKAYRTVRGVKPEDLVAATKELKKNWDRVAAEFSKSPAVKKAVKKGEVMVKKAGAAVKKAVKKAVKSAKPAKKARR